MTERGAGESGSPLTPEFDALCEAAEQLGERLNQEHGDYPAYSPIMDLIGDAKREVHGIAEPSTRSEPLDALSTLIVAVAQAEDGLAAAWSQTDPKRPARNLREMCEGTSRELQSALEHARLDRFSTQPSPESGSGLTAEDRERLRKIAGFLLQFTEGPDPHVDDHVRFLRDFASGLPESGSGEEGETAEVWSPYVSHDGLLRVEAVQYLGGFPLCLLRSGEHVGANPNGPGCIVDWPGGEVQVPPGGWLIRHDGDYYSHSPADFAEQFEAPPTQPLQGSEVERYRFTLGWGEQPYTAECVRKRSPDGPYVLHSDYTDLQAQLQRVEEERDRWMARCDEAAADANTSARKLGELSGQGVPLPKDGEELMPISEHEAALAKARKEGREEVREALKPAKEAQMLRYAANSIRAQHPGFADSLRELANKLLDLDSLTKEGD